MIRSRERNAVESILDRWPWREYQYKFGRWNYYNRITLWSILADNISEKKIWMRSLYTFQLFDPVDGTAFAEFAAPQRFGFGYGLARYSGMVRFAGDPTALGVLETNDGSDQRRLVCLNKVARSTALAEAHILTPGGGFSDDFRFVVEHRLIEPWTSRRRARYQVKGNRPRATSTNTPASEEQLRPWIADVPY